MKSANGEKHDNGRMTLSGVIDSVIQIFGSPERVRVVKLEKINALSGIGVGASIHFLVTISPVYRDNAAGGRPRV